MAVTFFQTVKSFAQFLNNWMLNGGGLVDQNTANIRAAICAGCHMNIGSSEARKGCRTCNKGADWTLSAIRDSIIRNKSTTSDGALKACGICGCDLKLSVWMPNAALLDGSDANAYPSFCFKKKILEDKEV